MKILVTDNGNFFVALDGNYGYFNQDGQLLKVSDERDWNWAQGKMKEFEGDPNNLNLDLSALEKERIPTIEEINEKNKTATFADLLKTALKK